MSLEETLADLHRRTSRRLGSRTPAIAAEASAIKALLQTAARHLVHDIAATIGAEALLEAIDRSRALAQRSTDAARERRCAQLERVRPARKVSDEQLSAACARGGSLRAIARLLGVNASTVSRRMRHSLPQTTDATPRQEAGAQDGARARSARAAP